MTFPAHYHPKDETVTVISGDFHVGMGDKLDMQKAKACGFGLQQAATSEPRHSQEMTTSS
jgi:hypothetical protein